MTSDPNKLYSYHLTDFSQLQSYALYVLNTIHKYALDNICDFPINILVSKFISILFGINNFKKLRKCYLCLVFGLFFCREMLAKMFDRKISRD